MTPHSAYAALKAHRARIYNLEHLQAIATWDRLTNMPPGAALARAAAQGELAALLQRMRADPSLDEWLARAAQANLDSDDAINLALLKRERLLANAVPEALVQRRAELAGAAGEAWRSAKRAGDWRSFAVAFEPLVVVIREIAARLGDRLGMSAYDALLDEYDRGMRFSRVKELCDSVTQWLPPLTAAIRERQAGEQVMEPVGPFQPDRQHVLCSTVMKLLGFDFGSGRLDAALHPFTGGTAEDVRLATRYSSESFLPALFGIVHETGHGRYQAGLPRQWLGQPLGEPCSASMHEAQALCFERHLARTRGCIELLSDQLREVFGPQPAFATANLELLVTRVRPDHIRVEADEVTYPAHIVLRTEIEAALIDGTLGVDDIPSCWNEGLERLLGLDAPVEGARGPLQDIHWSQGMIGYFPSYLVGAIVAAQLFDGFRAARPHWTGTQPEEVRQLGEWLDAQIWKQGSRFTTDELVTRATGQHVSADALHAHFQRRYLQ